MCKLESPDEPIALKDDYVPSGLTVVIPNYNGVQLFQQTLAPLFDTLATLPCPFEVIVVDDCSTDESLIYLQSKYPSIRLFRNEKNSGFATTINKGIKEAKYELILLLNSDIILTKDYFHHQFRYFSDSNTFGVMGRIIGWDNDVIQDAARYPKFHMLKIKTSFNYVVKPESKDVVYTLYLSGANALVKRDKIVEIGGFDELYSPFYVEDCDLSLRAWRMGWKCYYEHKAVCRHRTSSSIKSKNKKQYIETIYNRNKLYLHGIHLPGYLLPLYIMQMILESLFKAVLFRFTLLKAVGLFFSNLNNWMRSRNKMRLLQKTHRSQLTVYDITSFIRRSVKNRRAIKFLSGQLVQTTELS